MGTVLAHLIVGSFALLLLACVFYALRDIVFAIPKGDRAGCLFGFVKWLVVAVLVVVPASYAILWGWTSVIGYWQGAR